MLVAQTANTFYTETFRRKKPKFLVFLCGTLLIILSLLNILKLYNGATKFSYYDIIWFLAPIVFLYTLVDLLTDKTIFSVTSQYLNVTRGNFFYKKSKVYNIAEIEQIEVEPVKIKKLLPQTTIITSDKVVTFFYHDKEIALGFDRANFDAEKLKDAMLSAL